MRARTVSLLFLLCLFLFQTYSENTQLLSSEQFIPPEINIYLAVKGGWFIHKLLPRGNGAWNLIA